MKHRSGHLLRVFIANMNTDKGRGCASSHFSTNTSNHFPISHFIGLTVVDAHFEQVVTPMSTPASHNFWEPSRMNNRVLMNMCALIFCHLALLDTAIIISCLFQWLFFLLRRSRQKKSERSKLPFGFSSCLTCLSRVVNSWMTTFLRNG